MVVVTLVGFGVVVVDISVATGISPPCVTFVVAKVDVFVEGIPAMVVEMSENTVVWMLGPVVDWFLMVDSDVTEKFWTFLVVFISVAKADPLVAVTLEAGC